MHCIDNAIKIVDNKIKKIAQFPKLSSASNVKFFLETISITRQ